MAWQRGSAIWRPIPKAAPSNTPNGSVCWATRRPRCVSKSGSRPAHAPLNCGKRPRPRMSTSASRVALTGRCSCIWPAVAGSASTGACGTGKSFIACALGDKACRENLSVLYQRSSRLFGALTLARGDGRYARLMRQFARVDLLIIDDWGPKPLTAEQRRDLLEIVEDRYNCGSLIITSQVPVDRWYETVGDPTLADAILDRLVHNSHRIALTGQSPRKPETTAAEPEHQASLSGPLQSVT